MKQKNVKPIRTIGSKKYMYSWQDEGFDETRDYTKRFYWNPRYRDCRAFEFNYWHHGKGSGLQIALWYGTIEIKLRKGGWE